MQDLMIREAELQKMLNFQLCHIYYAKVKSMIEKDNVSETWDGNLETNSQNLPNLLNILK